MKKENQKIKIKIDRTKNLKAFQTKFWKKKEEKDKENR
jgi:hypothetical protein